MSAPAGADPAVASFPLVAGAHPASSFEAEPPPNALQLRERPVPKTAPAFAPARSPESSPASAAAAPAPQPQWTYLQAIDTASTPAVAERPEPARERAKDEWTLALATVSHAPVDLGGQVGLETPGRLRASAGYGVMPAVYLGPLTDVAALMAGDNAVGVALSEGSFSGRSWRLQAGLRPFASSGAYIEVGYASVDIEGQASLDASGSLPASVTPGVYGLSTHLDMWLVELGYQAKVADRVVLALALGALGTLNADTSVSGAGAEQASVDEQTAELDSKLEEYGILPTLTLRQGMDLI